jgi:hypothetical protein
MFYFTILLFSTLYSHAADLVCAREDNLQKNNNSELKFDTQMKLSSHGLETGSLLNNINIQAKCSATVSKILCGDVKVGVKVGLMPTVTPLDLENKKFKSTLLRDDDSHIFVKNDIFVLQLGRHKSVAADKLESGTQFTTSKKSNITSVKDDEDRNCKKASLSFTPTGGINLGVSYMLVEQDEKTTENRISFAQTYQSSSVLLSLVQEYAFSSEKNAAYGFGLKYNLNDNITFASSLTVYSPETKAFAFGGQYKQGDISFGASGLIKNDHYSLCLKTEYKVSEDVSLYNIMRKGSNKNQAEEETRFELGCKIDI